MARKNGVTIDSAVLRSKMRQMAKRAKVNEKDFIREQGALYAKDMAKAAPPIAGGKINLKKRTIGTAQDKKSGERAIMKDLSWIFVVQNREAVIIQKYKNFGLKPIYKGNRRIGKGVALSIPQIKRHHDQHQNPRTGRTKPLPFEARMWVHSKLLREYAKYEYENVGMAKASLMSSAININPKQSAGVPKWVSRHLGTVIGKGSLSVSSKGPLAKIRATAAGLQYVKKSIPFLQRFREVAMEKRMKAIVRANAKKSGFKVK